MRSIIFCFLIVVTICLSGVQADKQESEIGGWFSLKHQIYKAEYRPYSCGGFAQCLKIFKGDGHTYLGDDKYCVQSVVKQTDRLLILLCQPIDAFRPSTAFISLMF